MASIRFLMWNIFSCTALLLLLFFTGCTPWGVLQSGRTLGEGNGELSLGGTFLEAWVSENPPLIDGRISGNPGNFGWWYDIRYGLKEKLDIGIRINFPWTYFAIIHPPSLIEGQQVYCKWELTPKYSKVAISSMFGIYINTLFNYEDDYTQVPISPKLTMIASGPEKPFLMYGGVSYLYDGYLYGESDLAVWKPVVDNTPYPIYHAFIGGGKKILVEFGVSAKDKDTVVAHLFFCYRFKQWEKYSRK